jgi:hypothetical protein
MSRFGWSRSDGAGHSLAPVCHLGPWDNTFPVKWQRGLICKWYSVLFTLVETVRADP